MDKIDPNQMKQAIRPSFPTPIISYQWPNSEELNRQLIETIDTEKEKSPGIQRSNVGGWHSDSLT